MVLAARACFEPGAAMTMFTKLGALEKAQGVRIPTFLRTHPQSEARPRAQVAARCSWRGLLYSSLCRELHYAAPDSTADLAVSHKLDAQGACGSCQRASGAA